MKTNKTVIDTTRISSLTNRLEGIEVELETLLRRADAIRAERAALRNNVVVLQADNFRQLQAFSVKKGQVVQVPNGTLLPGIVIGENRLVTGRSTSASGGWIVLTLGPTMVRGPGQRRATVSTEIRLTFGAKDRLFVSG